MGWGKNWRKTGVADSYLAKQSTLHDREPMEPSKGALPVGKDMESDWSGFEAKFRNADKQGEQGRNHQGETGDEEYSFL